MEGRDLEELLVSFGIWKRGGGDERYRYRLSPATFPLSQSLQAQLRQLGQEVVLLQKHWQGLLLENDVKTNDGRLLQKLAVSACAGLPFVATGGPVPLCKVDLVLDQKRRPWIVEIDAYNPRGIPYAAFLAETRRLFAPRATCYPGVLSWFVSACVARNWRRVAWIYAHKERYYLPWFRALRQLLVPYGIDLVVLDVSDVGGGLPDCEGIVMVPHLAHQPQELVGVQRLLEEWCSAQERFLYPLVPWLASKGFLAFSQRETGSFVPQSTLVSKRHRKAVETCRDEGPVILKDTVASGMKGVWTESDPQFSLRLQERLGQKNPQAIVQRLLPQAITTLPFYGSEGVEEDSFFSRLTVYIANDGTVVDAEVTARTTPDVHGAPDCLQLPCAFA